MSLVKKIYVPLLGIIVCWIVFVVADTASYFGPFLNRFHPCVQDPMTSFPCSWPYDAAFMGLSIVAGAAFALLLVWKVIQYFRKRS